MGTRLEYIDELIAKVLADEASEVELKEVLEWRLKSGDNERYYKESERVFSAMDTIGTSYTVDTDRAWNTLNARLEKSEAKIIPFYKRTTVLRAAAGIALLALLTVVSKWFMNEEAIQPIVLKAEKTTEKKTLPDGSKVFMNKNSELSYAMTAKGERKVSLKGEAFFEVVHNEEKPFIINVDDVMIKDIGTAFNVKAFPENNTVEVVVESGEVQFYSSSNVGINLIKGEKAVYNKATGHFIKMLPTPTENTNSYRSKKFSFKETPLKEVVDQLNAVYELNIRLSDPALEHLKLSVSFHNEEPNSIVEIIADTFDLEVEKKDGALILKQKSPTN